MDKVKCKEYKRKIDLSEDGDDSSFESGLLCNFYT